MENSYIIALLIGLMAMMVVLLRLGEIYNISQCKAVIYSVMLLLVGVAGARLMYLVENQCWGGYSFFGALLLIPIIFYAVARFFGIPYGELMDVCAPTECVMLVILKLNCHFSGCCYGMILAESDEIVIRFPSQLVEAINGLVIMLVLVKLIKNGKHRGKIYPIFLVLYGITRVILNCFRGDLQPFVLGLSAGHFWALVSIVTGIVVLAISYRGKEADYEKTN
jgi:phosphatidylglycerol:prolipoprotein diacylglycerol transferase